jgi:pimeloyl-ACP methyl ester carboxylesterase
MLRRTLMKFVALGTAVVAAPALTHAEGERAMPEPTAARVNANGVELYYEIHGEGAPLIMLHGGVNPSDFFGETLATMAESHRVYAVHLRGHGLSKDKDEPWSYELMADDVAALMGEIGLESADVMGWSLGGGVGLQLAIRHPKRVKKLVVISMAYRADGDYPEIRAAFDTMPAEAPKYAELTSNAPFAALYPDIDWEEMFRKTGEMNQPLHDWSEGIAAITSPVLLIFADADSIQLEHMMAFYKLLGGGQRAGEMDGSGRSVNQLAIIPNRTHYDSVTSPAVTLFAKEFLGEDA